MKITKASINVIVFSCKPTKNGKGYMLLCAQGDYPFTVFSKNFVQPGTDLKELTVDLDCYVSRQSGEFKEFVSVSE